MHLAHMIHTTKYSGDIVFEDPLAVNLKNTLQYYVETYVTQLKSAPEALLTNGRRFRSAPFQINRLRGQTLSWWNHQPFSKTYNNQKTYVSQCWVHNGGILIQYFKAKYAVKIFINGNNRNKWTQKFISAWNLINNNCVNASRKLTFMALQRQSWFQSNEAISVSSLWIALYLWESLIIWSNGIECWSTWLHGSLETTRLTKKWLFLLFITEYSQNAAQFTH